MSGFSRVTTLKGQRLLGYDPVNLPQGFTYSPKAEKKRDYVGELPVTETKYTTDYQPINPPIQYNIQGEGSYPRNYNPEPPSRKISTPFSVTSNQYPPINPNSRQVIQSPISAFHRNQPTNYPPQPPTYPPQLNRPPYPNNRYQTSIVQPYNGALQSPPPPPNPHQNIVAYNNQYPNQQQQYNNRQKSMYISQSDVQQDSGTCLSRVCMVLGGLLLVLGITAGIFFLVNAIHNNSNSIDNGNGNDNGKESGIKNKTFVYNSTIDNNKEDGLVQPVYDKNQSMNNNSSRGSLTNTSIDENGSKGSTTQVEQPEQQKQTPTYVNPSFMFPPSTTISNKTTPKQQPTTPKQQTTTIPTNKQPTTTTIIPQQPKQPQSSFMLPPQLQPKQQTTTTDNTGFMLPPSQHLKIRNFDD